MGRSAKLMKRPTQKQKAVSKMAKAASKPVPQAEPERVVEESAGPKAKKRRMMRAKAEKKEAEVSGIGGAAPFRGTVYGL